MSSAPENDAPLLDPVQEGAVAGHIARGGGIGAWVGDRCAGCISFCPKLAKLPVSNNNAYIWG